MQSSSLKSSQSMPNSPGNFSRSRAFSISNATIETLRREGYDEAGNTFNGMVNDHNCTKTSLPDIPQLVISPAEESPRLTSPAKPDGSGLIVAITHTAIATNAANFITSGEAGFPWTSEGVDWVTEEPEQMEAGIGDNTLVGELSYPNWGGENETAQGNKITAHHVDFLRDAEPGRDEQLKQYQKLAKSLDERQDSSSHVSQASHVSACAWSTSDRLLQPVAKDTDEINGDTPIGEGPSEAKFARDGFCSCSRFSRLTKGDFTLLTEVECAIQSNTDLPFHRLNDIQELVDKMAGHQPKHEPSLLSWLATTTRTSSWMTLWARHRGKNRADNTYFYTQLRNKTKDNIRTLIQQLQDRYPESYRNQPADSKTQRKMDALLHNVHRLSIDERKRSVSEEAPIEGSDLSRQEENLHFGPEDWPDSEMGVILPHDMFMSSPEASVVNEDGVVPEPNVLLTPGPVAPPLVAPLSIESADLKKKQLASINATRETIGSGPISAWVHEQSQRKEQSKFPGSTHIENVSVPKPKTDQSDAAGTLIEGSPRSVFIVIGWFPDELHEPIEILVRVANVEHFLPDLKKHNTALRGWRSFLSFKSVQGFDLYKCHTSHFMHSVRHTTKEDRVTLAHFYDATNASYFRAPSKPTSQLPTISGTSHYAEFLRWLQRKRKNRRYKHRKKREDSKQWAEWVHNTMNLGKDSPFESQLSLKLVLNWSKRRIAIAALITLALSLGVGIYFMQTHEGVEGTSAAWTIAAYIVTAGAFIIAMIAILTALKDGQTTPFQIPRMSDNSAV